MDRAVSGSDEPALLGRLRVGEDAAFGELFEQHAAAVRRLARGLASDSSEAEDITAETFFRVLQAVRRGNGPRDNVRAYLLTVARRVCWEWHGARRDVPVTDDELTNRVGAGADSQNRTAESTLITRAFSSLPERWRTVLWQTEVEGVQPAHAARDFGLSANATAALARRARLGLRAAYLQAHLAVDRSSDGCRTVMEKLGGYTAGSVTGAEARKIKAHLGTCASCRSTHDELREVCSSLRAHAGVIVLFVPAAGLASMATGAGTAGLGGAAGSATASAGTTTSAGGVTAASAGSAGGLAATSGFGGTAVAVGANVKVGLALASTAAVGVVGMVGPSDPHTQDQIGLPSDGNSAELHIAEPRPSERLGSAVVPGTGHTVQDYLEQHRAGARPGAESEPAEQPATEYTAPEGVQIAGEAKPPQTPAGGTELPGVAAGGAPGKGNGAGRGTGEDNGQGNGRPRSDPPAESPPTGTPMGTSEPATSSPGRTPVHSPGKPESPPAQSGSASGKPDEPPGQSKKSPAPSTTPAPSSFEESGEDDGHADDDACRRGGPPSWAPARDHDDREYHEHAARGCGPNEHAGFPPR
ncbi:sigma-70 family RNA polymerase sigma factor [Prauserella muralis]|uniref:Uncharacterized protein n=1 Tax=Prauserella muralis TaxID=588067 RepID=A0A2V4B9D5_9PSEU|nr:sigma-70 family RNA polymerase sigma factor [Prauserella muralis]PXY31786.1 hypothetical protein BAY60_05430 [Prauserella muralis]TWE13817.1 RNA polymerase sigma factor (sigma-70 family) [Prauserella muralis]